MVYRDELSERNKIRCRDRSITVKYEGLERYCFLKLLHCFNADFNTTDTMTQEILAANKILMYELFFYTERLKGVKLYFELGTYYMIYTAAIRYDAGT